jgi:hypothetical protein
MDDSFSTVNIAVASLTCVLVTSIGFNRPSWSRSFTTAWRYRLAFAAHMALYLVLMAAIFALLRRIFAPHTINGSATGDSADWLVWGALLVTLFARTLSARPRAWLHRLAGIPVRAQRLALLLADGDFQPDPKVVEQAHATLLTRGVDVDADWLPLAAPAHRLLLRATGLFLQLRQWEEQRRFKRFIREAKNDFDLMRRRYDRISFRVSRTLASIERMGAVRHLFTQRPDEAGTRTADASKNIDVLLRKIVVDLIADSCEDIVVFNAEACLLTARAAMATRATKRGRHALVARLGFKPKIQADTVGYAFLGPVAALVYTGMWLFFLNLPSTDPKLPHAGLVMVVSLVVFGAISIAIVPKLRWGFANADLHGRTPKLFVAGAGGCALIFAVTVNLAAGALLLGGVAGALQRLRFAAPWLLGSSLLASVMAWLVQDHRWRDTPSPRRRRLFDAATMGTVMMLSSLIGRLLAMEWQSIKFSALMWFATALGSLVFGALLGFVTPEFARRRELRLASPTVHETPADFSLFRPSTMDA